MTIITIQSPQAEAVTTALRSAIDHEIHQLTQAFRRTEDRLIALAVAARLDPMQVLEEQELPDTLAEDFRLEIEGERDVRNRLRHRLTILTDVLLC